MNTRKLKLITIFALILVALEAEATMPKTVKISQQFPQLVSSVEFVVDGSQLQVEDQYRGEKGRCKIETVLAYSSRSGYTVNPSNKSLNDYRNKELDVVQYTSGLVREKQPTTNEDFINRGEHVRITCSFESDGIFSATTPFDNKSIAFLSALGINVKK